MQNNHPKSENAALKEHASQDKNKRGLEQSKAREAKDHSHLPQSNATGDREDASNPKDGRGPLKKSASEET